MALNTALTLFEYDPTTPSCRAPMSMRKMFRRNDELPKLMSDALSAHPEGLDTRELAIVALKARGFDDTDAVLRRGMATKVINTLYKLRLRGKITKAGMRAGVVVWRLPA